MLFNQHYTDAFIVECAKTIVRKKLHVKVDAACIITKSVDCVSVKVLHEGGNTVISLTSEDLKSQLK